MYIELYNQLIENHADILHTSADVKYLVRSEVVLVCVPSSIYITNLIPFLAGFSSQLKFEKYTEDDILMPGTDVCKFAGQLCYLSFGPERTTNENAKKYFDNIKSSGHWSVLEHANYGFLIYGVDRACTHELVRHRKLHPSQVSQRYCGEKTIRFVEREEFQCNNTLHELFKERIDKIAKEYHSVSVLLSSKNLTGNNRLHRKATNQAARAILTNEVEAPIYMTGNVRDWRDFINKRATVHTDKPIRLVAIQILLALIKEIPPLFDDYQISQIEDGSYIATSPYLDRG